MPFYELILTVRPTMNKTELTECLKRVATMIWNERGVLRKIEYLGYKKLPFKGRSKEEGVKFDEANQFVYHISIPQLKMKVLKPELRLDMDIISNYMAEANDSLLPEGYECTLEEEMRTPFYRNSVQPLIANKNSRASVRRIENIYKDNK